MSCRIYLDAVSGTPLLPEVRHAMIAWLARVGNSSNYLHQEGREAAEALEAARRHIAALIGASPEEIYFASSGTESNVWAIRGLLALRRSVGKHLVISAIEHLSILNTARQLEREGYRVTLVPVDQAGRVSLDDVVAALRPETALVCVMWANHEVGTIQPIAEIAAAVRERGVRFHTDAIAAVGSVEVSVSSAPVDALSLAANQFGGPAGAAALYVREGLHLPPLFHGGIQEQGRRAGTENLLGIIGMGAAASVAREQLATWAAHRRGLRDQLESSVRSQIPDVHVFGQATERLPGHCCFAFDGVDGESLALGLDREGIAIVQSSACSSRALKASHVLRAMQIPDALAQHACLVTVGWYNTAEEITLAAQAIERVVQQLRMTATLIARGG